MSTRIHTPDLESNSDEQTETTTECPDCAGELTPRGGETICTDCGLVVAEYRIDHGPEWRSYTDDGQEQERTGAPLTETRHDRGLSTEIGRGTDGNGNLLSSKKRRQLGRLRQAQYRGRFKSKAERILAHGLADIRRMTSALGLPEYVRDRACSLFRHAQREGLLRGRSIEGLTSASVYATCRCDGLPWTLSEVADVTCISQSELGARYRKLNAELGLPAQPPSPSAFVPRLAAEFACVALPLNCHQHTETNHSHTGTDHQPTDVRYRILEDTHCLRHLTDSDRATLKREFVETGDLELLSEGTTFISLRNPNPDPTADADIARRLLRTLYDVELANVGRIEEVVHATDRTVFWRS